MPAVLEMNRGAIEDRIARAAAYLGLDGGFEGFMALVMDLRASLGIPERLGDMGVTEVVIESVDLSLYIAHARIDGREHVIADRQGKVLKTRNLLEMQRMLRKAVTCEFFLRQRSAYDEMVGHAHQAADNSMELPLGREPLPEWLN